jgi:hypothetical protein
VDRLLSVRTVVAVALGGLVAVVLDQVVRGGQSPSLAGSVRFGLLVAALLLLVVRKARRDRERSEASWSGPA